MKTKTVQARRATQFRCIALRAEIYFARVPVAHATGNKYVGLRPKGGSRIAGVARTPVTHVTGKKCVGLRPKRRAPGYRVDFPFSPTTSTRKSVLHSPLQVASRRCISISPGFASLEAVMETVNA